MHPDIPSSVLARVHLSVVADQLSLLGNLRRTARRAHARVLAGHLVQSLEEHERLDDDDTAAHRSAVSVTSFTPCPIVDCA